MSSSTSSSERAGDPRIFRKTLLVILLGMAAALGILRLIAELNNASKEGILERVTEAQEALPAIIALEDELAMFFGSSMVHAGYSPRLFDQWLAEKGITLKSFNFGFGGLNPYFQDYLSRRIRDEFVANDRRLALAMIEFNPFQTTKTRWNGALPAVDSFLTMLATDAELLEIAKEDLTRGVRLFTIRYFRNDISAEIITAQFAQSLQAPPQRSDIPVDEEAAARRDEILEALEGKLAEDYPDYNGEEWYWPWQGGPTIPSDRSEETVALIQELMHTGLTDRRMDNDRLNRIRTADIIELQFEEILVESFIRIVENFKEFSDHVEVILLPRNTDWIDYSPEGWKRLEKIIARIERETGIKMLNLQDTPEVTPDMFSDTTHLGRYTGDIAFTRLLADEMARSLNDR
ncbi:MAG: hypothetical protein HKN15_13915 [Xanthomonadales bacterium]|nr:hypothetical protein [Xanthomonadales bacterium]